MQLTLLVTVFAATAGGCGLHRRLEQGARAKRDHNGPPFSIQRLTKTTHLIIQNDDYIEYPFIYVKQYLHIPLTLVVDTGCGAQNGKPGNPAVELKDFIEEKLPLKHGWIGPQYMVATSHCHFDHISGIQPFANAGADIVSSGFNKSFIAPENLAANALTTAFGTITPSYNVSTFAAQHERLMYKSVDLGLLVLQTPGHTPDSMAIYDENERWIFTGDTLYRRNVTVPWGAHQDLPIILPLQANWKDFVNSIEALLAFLNEKDHDLPSEKCVRLGAGHSTADVPASKIIESTLDFIRSVERGDVPVIAKLPGDEVAPGGDLGDGTFFYWQSPGNPEFSLLAPASFRKDFKAT